MSSIFEQIGGQASVDAAVDGLYVRVLADPRLLPTFAGIDVERVKRHQRVFIAAALGGTGEYRGHSMRQAHVGLRITDEQFDAVATHLADTLRGLGLEFFTVEAILKHIALLRDQIVSATRSAE